MRRTLWDEGKQSEKGRGRIGAEEGKGDGGRNGAFTHCVNALSEDSVRAKNAREEMIE